MDTVVAAMYEASAGVRDWSSACAVLADALDLWCVQIVGLFKSNNTIAFTFEGGKAPPEAALQNIMRYQAINPRYALGPLLDVHRWVHDHEHFDDAFVSTSPFFQEFLIPFGGRYASATKLIDEEIVVLLTLHRGNGKVPLDQTSIESVDRIRMHLAHAIRTHFRRRSARPVVAAGQVLLEALPQGVLIVDDTRFISFANSPARAILEQGDVLINRDGRLDATDARRSRDLLVMIHSLGLGGSIVAERGADRAVLRLAIPARASDLLVIALAVRPETSLGAFGDDPCAILVLHPLSHSPRLDPLIASLAFNLSPAEAIVATAIAEGASPDDVAKKRGVSLATVRTQLRGIYAKLGVRRLPDMIRLLLELPRLRGSRRGSIGDVELSGSKTSFEFISTDALLPPNRGLGV